MKKSRKMGNFLHQFSIDLSKLSLILCLFFLRGVRAMELDFTVDIPPGRMECFFQNITEAKYKTAEIDYQVIDGGDLKINFLVLNPQHTQVINNQQMSDGSGRLEVDVKGDYQICFDNTYSYNHRKVVFFEIFLYDHEGRLDELDFEGLGDLEQIGEDIGMKTEDFQGTSSRIKMNLNKAEHYQSLLRAWEARDRSILDSNTNRVNFWSIVNTAVLVSVGLIQVYMIRSLFEENSRLGKAIRGK